MITVMTGRTAKRCGIVGLLLLMGGLAAATGARPPQTSRPQAQSDKGYSEEANEPLFTASGTGLTALPPLRGYTQSWLGNTYFARNTNYSQWSTYVPWLVHDIAVSDEGKMAYQSTYNEIACTYNIVKEGHIVGEVGGMNGHRVSGQAVAIDNRYLFVAVDGFGIRRFKTNGDQFVNDLSPGRSSTGNENWPAVQARHLSGAETYSGLALGGGLLFASDSRQPPTDKEVSADKSRPHESPPQGIRIFDEQTLESVRTLPFVGAGHLASTKNGAAVWVIQHDANNYPVRIVKLNTTTGAVLARITDVAQPRDIAVDSQGKLLVAAAFPDRQIRIYRSDGTYAGAFGVPGGIFTGRESTRGRRCEGAFENPIGVGIDAGGRLYVASAGSEWPVDNELSCFAPLPNGKGWKPTPLWHLEGLMIEDYAVPDPTDENTYYSLVARFHLDWNRQPGQEGQVVGKTLDRDHYPQDPRLYLPSNSALGIIRLHGQKFLVATGMEFFRLDPTKSGEVATPSLYISLRDPAQDAAKCYDPSLPASRNPVPCTADPQNPPRWPPYRPNASRGFVWRDQNGDGRINTDEYQDGPPVPPGYTCDSPMVLAPDGALWCVYRQENNDNRYVLSRVLPADHLDSVGNPVYDFGHPALFPLPGGTYPVQYRFSEQGDFYVLGCDIAERKGIEQRTSKADLRIEKWSHFAADPSHPVKAWTIPHIARQTRVTQPINQTNDDACTLRPAGDYLFVGGCYNGLVGVYGAAQGNPVGLMRTLHYIELLDATDIKVQKRANGEYDVCYNSYINNSNILYRWTPAKTTAK